MKIWILIFLLINLFDRCLYSGTWHGTRPHKGWGYHSLVGFRLQISGTSKCKVSQKFLQKCHFFHKGGGDTLSPPTPLSTPLLNSCMKVTKHLLTTISVCFASLNIFTKSYRTKFNKFLDGMSRFQKKTYV